MRGRVHCTRPRCTGGTIFSTCNSWRPSCLRCSARSPRHRRNTLWSKVTRSPARPTASPVRAVKFTRNRRGTHESRSWCRQLLACRRLFPFVLLRNRKQVHPAASRAPRCACSCIAVARHVRGQTLFRTVSPRAVDCVRTIPPLLPSRADRSHHHPPFDSA